jgi:tetratricopeptide (TPR) repeat protein
MLRILSQPLGPDGHRLVREEGEVHVIGTGRFLSRYRFAHALFQEYLYHALSAGERRLLHSEIAMALEETYADQSDEIAAELAHHYAEARHREKAIEYALRAGHQARLTYANREAITFYERALKLLPTFDVQASPPLGRLVPHKETEMGGKESAARRLETLKGLGQVSFALGDLLAAEAHMKEAIALGQEIELAPRELVRLYHWLLEALYAQGRYEEEIALAEQALALLGDDVNTVEAALMNHHLHAGHAAIGNNEFSVPFRARCAQIVKHLPYAEELLPVFWSILTYYEEDLKNVQEAEQWLRILQQHAKRHRDMRASAETYIHAGYLLLNQGDCRGAISQFQKGLELATKIGDARATLWNHRGAGFAALTLGDLRALREHADRILDIAEDAAQIVFIDTAYRFIGILNLCHGAMEKAADAFQKSTLGHIFDSKVWGRVALGRTYLLQGNRQEALMTLDEALSQAPPDPFLQWPFAAILSGIEEAYEDGEAFRAYCRRAREERPEIEDSGFKTWYAEPVAQESLSQIVVHESFADSPLSAGIEADDWVWHDPFGDCSYSVGNGLEIRAANGRELWYINLSAPRLLRPVPSVPSITEGEGQDFAAETVCTPSSAEAPAIGGLLLWRDNENYLRLDRGTRGPCEISFQGCLGNKDVMIGRGRLESSESSGRVYLRMERTGDRVRALCSADGAAWFTVGHVEFAVEDPIQIGLHAIGMIDRTACPGAYPDGTAIRFESFTLWGMV